MVEVHPFRGVRYDPAVVGDVASATAPALDDVGRFTYASRRTASPYTILELLAEGLAGSYDHAGHVLRQWWRTGVLISDAAPTIYRYEEHHLRDGVPVVQRGLCVALTVTPFGTDGPVLPHEQTDPTRVAARAARLHAVPLDVSPVFGLYRGAPETLRAVLDAQPDTPPVAAITDEAGTDHRVWRLDASAVGQVQAALASVQLVIADGHHRYASALSVAQQRGPGAHGRTLAYLVDAQTHGPDVQPVHRLVRHTGGQFIHQLQELFDVQQVDLTPAQATRQVLDERGLAWALYVHASKGPKVYLLRPHDEQALVAGTPSAYSETWRALDTAVLHHVVLPRLGIGDGQVAARSDLGGAVEEVGNGNAAALFMLRPVAADTVVDLAQRGELMPAKSTAFSPKPRTGLVMRAADTDHLP